MQVQQSGYRFSRAILSCIPKPAFILAILLLLALMVADAFLALSSKPTLGLDECLAQYYDLTHPNISTFLIEQTNKTNITIPLSTDVTPVIKYLNQSRIVEFHSQKSIVGGQCQIQLNYRPTSQIEALAYLVSNYPLFNINRTDQQFCKKHGIIVDKITIPEINVGYRYFGADLLVSQLEDFLFALRRDFAVFEKKLIYKIAQYSQQIDKQMANLTKITNDKNITNDSTAGDDKKIQKNDQVQKIDKKVNIQSVINQPSFNRMKNRNLQQTKVDTKNTSQPIAEENTTNIAAQIQKLKNQKMLLFTVISNLLTKSSYQKHKVLYNYGYSSRWSSLILFSTSSSGYIWKLLGKFFTACFVALYAIGCFYLISIAVRYGFILTTLLFSQLGSKCYMRVGWMERFLGIYRNKAHERGGIRNSQIKLQIVFSFLAMYSLLAIIGYLLSKAGAAVFGWIKVLPQNNYYTNSLMVTFYMVQIAHYIFMRSRASLQYFSKFSFLSTIFILMITSQYLFFYNSYLMHLLFLLNVLFIICFLFLEKCVLEEQYQSGYKPCLEKPRMLFYLGYDLDWHRGLPPIWTMFQPWFDLSYASEQERCYIDQNYQLLYGRLMGVNQPQQIPDDSDQLEQSQNLPRAVMLQNSDAP